MHHKDDALNRLAEVGNVAQFVSFRAQSDGTLVQSHSRVIGHEPNQRFENVCKAVETLLAASVGGAVNVRSYSPNDPRSYPFEYGLKTVEDTLAQVERLASQGLHLIVNETVDVEDGGVSGVAHGDVIEFAPDDTPRAVEKPDVASLPRDIGLAILKAVYGFAPDLPGDRSSRIEFSIHPGPTGWRRTKTLLWEIEDGAEQRRPAPPRWPNRFSRFIGDKAFGLLVADQLGEPVPATTAIARRVAPFAFGRPTGSGETWIRTCPDEPDPGRYTTAKGWRDPFKLMGEEDPDGRIMSVLAQDGVPAFWSGAAIVGGDHQLIVEGRHGQGDLFMLGTQLPELLPDQVRSDIEDLHARLCSALGPVRLEWVHDRERPWVVQLHVGATRTTDTALVDGEAEHWVEFNPSAGLTELRRVLARMPRDAGMLLTGDVGLTSHVADVLRKWGRPARMTRR